MKEKKTIWVAAWVDRGIPIGAKGFRKLKNAQKFMEKIEENMNEEREAIDIFPIYLKMKSVDK